MLSLFPEPKFVQQLDKKDEEEKTEKNLIIFIEKIGERLKKEGVPLNKEARIDMDAFSKIYSQKEIEKDKELIKDREKKWQEKENKEEIKRTGEKLEMLKTAIFSKFLAKDFIVVRTSRYDDIYNGVDNLILEKETGNTVCAFDEVGETSGPRYQEKIEKILLKNKRNGGELKYGLKLEKDEESEKTLKLGKLEKIPIFYLALNKKYIDEGLKNLVPDFEIKSDYEKKLFDYFLSALNVQISHLNLEKDLDPVLKKRLSYFQKSLERFEKKN